MFTKKRRVYPSVAPDAYKSRKPYTFYVADQTNTCKKWTQYAGRRRNWKSDSRAKKLCVAAKKENRISSMSAKQQITSPLQQLQQRLSMLSVSVSITDAEELSGRIDS